MPGSKRRSINVVLPPRGGEGPVRFPDWVEPGMILIAYGSGSSRFSHLRCERRLDVAPSAGHLFEEPGARESYRQLDGLTGMRVRRLRAEGKAG